jgi:hypothetical protein
MEIRNPSEEKEVKERDEIQPVSEQRQRIGKIFENRLQFEEEVAKLLDQHKDDRPRGTFY